MLLEGKIDAVGPHTKGTCEHRDTVWVIKVPCAMEKSDADIELA